MKKVIWLLAAGVAIGLLIAPDKGSKTWRKVADSLDDLKDKAKKSLDDLSDAASDIAKKGKKGAQKISGEW